jgi:hypothetical protein
MRHEDFFEPNYVASLTQLGKEASSLVDKRDFSALADRFGYALSYGRNPAKAIENDFLQCIAEAESPSSNTVQSIQVKYFKPDDSQFYALVECIVPVAHDSAVLVELVVFDKDEAKHITLEQISYIT